MKALVIAEKPSVARDIARVLKCGKKINGAIEGERYIVTWGLGHLVTLADPEDYDKKYKGLDKTFYTKEMFINFADQVGAKCLIVRPENELYWNNKYVFDCYLIK